MKPHTLTERDLAKRRWLMDNSTRLSLAAAAVCLARLLLRLQFPGFHRTMFVPGESLAYLLLDLAELITTAVALVAVFVNVTDALWIRDARWINLKALLLYVAAIFIGGLAAR